jgi:type VI secretion system secreted protein VgrG
MSPPPIQISSPLPPEDLMFQSLSLSQGLSRLEELELELVSPKETLAPEDLLGQKLGVVMALPEGAQRHFHGIVTRFGIGPPRGRFYGYRASVRPWLWMLTRTSDCRIFQEQTVPEIVEAVFKDHAAIASFEFKLFRAYRPRNYCVQYRETDFNFVARLLEDEGIYWYFEHSEGEHRLMLVDDVGALNTAPGCDSLPFYGNPGQVPPDTEYINAWAFSREVQPGKCALTSYDFERPALKLEVQASIPRSHEIAEEEQFDFQGDYIQKADGQRLADNRIEERQAHHERLSGSTNAQGLGAGHLFKLTRHPREDQNAEYLCVQSSIQAEVNAYEAGNDAGRYDCSFAAIPSSQIFRPQRRTPKPFVQGPQTAVVVGPSGEEIFTDKYGRVKVQFHWDRYGKKNEKSSTWVRTSSPWAGSSFGFVQIPRIGQEVVVDFLEGDPDQPIITGRVYNAEQMPPWELPANATQSGVLTRSSKGGAYGNANALRFEDKKGAEELWLHAEKNQRVEVENDESHWVGHDRSKNIDHDETVHVKHDRTETVDNNETITIGVDRSESVGSNETIAIGVNRTETVGSNESITVGVNQTISIGADRSITVGGSETATVAMQRTHAVGINESIAIGAAQEIVVGAAQSVSIGAIQDISVGLNQSTSVGKNQSVDVGGGQTQKIGKNRDLKVGGGQNTTIAKARVVKVGEDDGLNVGKKLVIEAGDSITFKVGSASIVLKKDGTITIDGKDLTLKGSGKITVNASSDMVLKGSKISQN